MSQEKPIETAIAFRTAWLVSGIRLKADNSGIVGEVRESSYARGERESG